MASQQQLMDDFACFADPKLKPGQGTITIGYCASWLAATMLLLEQISERIKRECRSFEIVLSLSALRRLVWQTDTRFLAGTCAL